MSLQGTSSVEQKRLVALIIGQSNYEFMEKLCSSILDAELIDKTLQNIGFSTTVLIDKTNEELNIELKNFSEKQQPEDIVFLYYSGHALSQIVKNKTDNHLFGVDAKWGDSKDGVQIIKGVALQEQIFYRYFLENCIYLVVLDACRKYPNPDQKIKGVLDDSNNPKDSSVNKMTFFLDFLPEDIKFPQMDLVYACQPGEIAKEPITGEVGYLARALSTALRKPGTWKQALVEIIDQVQLETNNTQNPVISQNVKQKIFIKPQALLLPKILQEPQIIEENLEKSNIDTFKFSVKNGVASNQLIKLEQGSGIFRVYPKKTNNDIYGVSYNQNYDTQNITFIKGVKIVSDNPSFQCQSIFIVLEEDSTIQIEDCIFEGVGLAIINNTAYNIRGRVNVNRVKITNAPEDGLSFVNVKSVKVENVTTQNCGARGIEVNYAIGFNLQNCYVSDCVGGVGIFETENFLVKNIDVYNCEEGAFHFQESKGIIRDSGYRKCDVGIWDIGDDSEINCSNVNEI